MKKILLLLLFLSVSLNAKAIVSVSIIPQIYFVKKIAKDTLDINLLVKPGESPASYEPKAKQMLQLQKSDIYFAIGVPYENVWVDKFKEIYPKLKIIKTDENIKKMYMKSHDHLHKDKNEILDPHIWLDPLLVKIQAENIAKALTEEYPQFKDFYKKNLTLFLKELDELHEQINVILKHKKGKKFLVYHPSWGYFAHRYGLIQRAIEIEGKEVKAKDLQKIIHDAKQENIKTIFVQPQFSQKSANIIASSINGSVVKVDQLSIDWEQELLKTANILAR